jgi:hypothetical protein
MAIMVRIRFNFFKGEKKERGGEVVNRVVEFSAKSKVSERGREVVHWLIKICRKAKMGECGRERGKRVVVSGSQFRRETAKGEVGERGG